MHNMRVLQLKMSVTHLKKCSFSGMNSGRFVLSQVLDLIHRQTRKCVKRKVSRLQPQFGTWKASIGLSDRRTAGTFNSHYKSGIKAGFYKNLQEYYMDFRRKWFTVDN